MKQPGANLHLPNMLVLDSFRGHIYPGVKEAIYKANTDLVVIPPGFKKCCISNTLDGSEDDILWEAADDCGEFDDDLILCTPDKDEALDND
ncbi:hypothetical protein HPB51_018476 [Rhipicephalus microplus]|uniref:DDE-1 domain-containing protein n=1 Tax=Rhipicephalus microplus TaxID=6941 RepID=A0A9J6DBB0_RHIMP|nr:hypothetical protein HPB51_018476 [Rhipicephalus microplus]